MRHKRIFLPGIWLLVGAIFFLTSPSPVAAQMACTADSPAVTPYEDGDPATDDILELVRDCNTLLGLKDTLRGTATLDPDWSVDTPIADWDGVGGGDGGGGTGRVTWLILSGKNLNGTLPTALAELDALTSLDLSNNQLTGSIPDVSDLTSLDTLDLSRNQLDGEIPDLSDLTSLLTLYLNDNQLTGSIPDIGARDSLHTLALYNNRLNGSIPPTFSVLTGLRLVYLHNNQLSGEIPDISGLTFLTRLYLSNNQLSGPIPALNTLTNLIDLRLHHNQLTGAIPDFSSLNGLEWLWLHNNRLQGAIPDLSSLPLKQFYLYGNPGLLGPPPAWFTQAGLDVRHSLVAWVDIPAGSAVTSTFTAGTTHLNADHQEEVRNARLPTGTRFSVDHHMVYDITVRNRHGDTIHVPLSKPLEVCLPIPADIPAESAYIYRLDATGWQRQTDGRRLIASRTVCTRIDRFSFFAVGHFTAPTTGGGGGGGGGGGPSCTQDQHGNRATRATALALATPTRGTVCPARDVDYFTVTAPGHGLLFVWTTDHAAHGTVWQGAEKLAAGMTAGDRPSQWLYAIVEKGPVVVALRGSGRSTGPYTVTVTFVPPLQGTRTPGAF